MNRQLALIAICLAGVSGCALWTDPATDPPSLPLARMAPDAVVLEVESVFLPGRDVALNEEIWGELDEQQFPVELRRQLHANGMRAGTSGLQLPGALQAMIEKQAAKAAEAKLESSEKSISATRHHLQSRTGKRGVITASKKSDEDDSVVLLRENGAVTGHEYPAAQTLFAIKTYPQDDGSVKVELTPEVEWGKAKQTWVGSEATWRVETTREREVFAKLRTTAMLSPGQTLILSGEIGDDGSMRGLGRFFFSQKSEDGVEQRVVIIRLVQTQHDALFKPDTAELSPIETTKAD